MVGWYGPQSMGCSCCADCEISDDDFNRADSTDLGSDWNEASGTAEILSNELKMGGSGATVLNTNPHDRDTNRHMIVSVSFKAANAGTFIDVLVDSTDTSGTSHHKARVTIGGNGSLKLYKDGVELATKSASFPTNTYHTITVCIDSDTIIAVANTTTLAAKTTPHDGAYAGLQSDREAFWDDYTSDKALSAEDPQCSPCTEGAACSECDDDQFPDFVLVDIPALANVTCSTCSDIQQTILLESGPLFQSPTTYNHPKTGATNCMWGAALTDTGGCGTIGGVNRVLAYVWKDGADVKLGMQVQLDCAEGGPEIYEWEKVFEGVDSIDCVNLADDLSYLAESCGCTFSGSPLPCRCSPAGTTATITAV